MVAIGSDVPNGLRRTIRGQSTPTTPTDFRQRSRKLQGCRPGVRQCGFERADQARVCSRQSRDDGVVAPAEMNVVDQRWSKLRAQFGHHAAGRLRPVRTHVGEEGITPEGAAVRCRVGPGILGPAEGDAVFLGDVVVAADIFLPPIQLIRLAGVPIVLTGRETRRRIGIEVG